jgi:uncharacterized membrane protein YccC
MTFSFLVGLIAAVLGFFGLQLVKRHYNQLTLPALMLFIVSTQPLGYLIWGEPRASAYGYGWIAGLFVCAIWGFWQLSQRKK